MKITDRLPKSACSEARIWLDSLASQDDQEAWDACDNLDWMLWILNRRRANRTAMVLSACACARAVLHLIQKGEDRPRIAIEATEKWCRGEASSEDVKVARQGAYAAYAACPAGSSRSAYAYPAAYAYSGAYAYVAYAYAAHASARADPACTPQSHCDILRRYFPAPPSDRPTA